mmetsp:Transcript_5821/g.9519  ORF Transcript_5821/g.9519 Transcript_5821/m.9519 type:complete len:84 (+) Transcript_5821:502-753(+)
MGNKSLATPIKGFIAHGAKIMVMYNCCLDASIPNSLKRGRPSDMTRAKTPPEMKHCCMAIQERNSQEKKEDSSVKNCLVELNG